MTKAEIVARKLLELWSLGMKSAAGETKQIPPSMVQEPHADQLALLRQKYQQYIPKKLTPLQMLEEMRQRNEEANHRYLTDPRRIKTPEGSYQDAFIDAGEAVGNVGYTYGLFPGYFTSRVGRAAAGIVGGVMDAATGRQSEQQRRGGHSMATTQRMAENARSLFNIKADEPVYSAVREGRNALQNSAIGNMMRAAHTLSAAPSLWNVVKVALPLASTAGQYTINNVVPNSVQKSEIKLRPTDDWLPDISATWETGAPFVGDIPIPGFLLRQSKTVSPIVSWTTRKATANPGATANAISTSIDGYNFLKDTTPNNPWIRNVPKWNAPVKGYVDIPRHIYDAAGAVNRERIPSLIEGEKLMQEYQRFHPKIQNGKSTVENKIGKSKSLLAD